MAASWRALHAGCFGRFAGSALLVHGIASNSVEPRGIRRAEAADPAQSPSAIADRERGEVQVVQVNMAFIIATLIRGPLENGWRAV
ncbi:hypothetical protein BWP39_10555 [Paraburkholderia acidicola]|uniref:Uncharacterized protein n=1 Tax=Paraburkholderia acidicola TaxID=1912599 RepID=A0A2A4EX28_9BURK|nr:hypothetical protein BWP39_10555 [Paraburkholderia acidicola]